jgi:hypothetical protein
MEEEYLHVVDLQDLLDSLEAMKEGLEICDKDYRRGYTNACDLIIDHYSKALQDLKDAEKNIVEH